jgi:antitoxin (DNA-binding transcriptional repressor) of toxin-antitoxin stability system
MAGLVPVPGVGERSTVLVNAVRPAPMVDGYARPVAPYDERRSEISAPQLAADTGSVIRGLRRGEVFTLTVDGEPLAEIVPLPRWRGVPRDAALAAFAGVPALDVDDLRRDLDDFLDDELRDPFEGTGW